MNRLVSGAIGVEIALKNNDSKVYFDDIAILRNKRIKHIDVYPYIKTMSGLQTVDSQYMPSAAITIVEKNTQDQLIQSLPLSFLHYSANRLFINKVIDFPHTYIDVSHIDNANKGGKSLYFVFWYDEPLVWSKVPDENNRTEIHPLEIQLTSTKTFFKENLVLQDRKVQNILFSYPYYTPQGNLGIASNVANSKFITLKKDQTEFISRVPLLAFEQTTKGFPVRLQNIVFDIQESYIETANTTADDLKSVFLSLIVDDNHH